MLVKDYVDQIIQSRPYKYATKQTLIRDVQKMGIWDMKLEEVTSAHIRNVVDSQLVIAGLLERGYNNAEIGLEIGYSESLIRQETVAIYRKLNVTGRKAMQAIRTLHLENHPDLEIIQ